MVKIKNGLHEKAEEHWRAQWVVGAAKVTKELRAALRSPRVLLLFANAKEDRR